MRTKLDNNKNIVNLMPSVHTTTCKNFTDLLNDNKLKAKPCNKFIGNDYAYLYYGRANYKNGKEEHFYDAYASSCILIFKTSMILNKIERIFPFDSGGHNAYLVGGKLSAEYDIEDFCLGKNISSCNSIISQFWGTKLSYFDAYEPLSITDDDLCKSYSKLISPISTTNGIDDRASAIELILNQDVELSCLTAIVIPDFMSDMIEVEELKSKFEITVIEYEYSGETSQQLYWLTKSKVKSFFRLNGVFDEKL